MVPVTGLEYIMEHPAETPGGNSPPDCCIWIGSSPPHWIQKKRTPGRGSLFWHKLRQLIQCNAYYITVAFSILSFYRYSFKALPGFFFIR